MRFNLSLRFDFFIATGLTAICPFSEAIDLAAARRYPGCKQRCLTIHATFTVGVHEAATSHIQTIMTIDDFHPVGSPYCNA
ncbi:hypothetical protein DFH27DRAFT_317440 [Peziza echinospora]|nr:hypothetical protein DFH27DRAFT_317440 [Peziza echinospora]